MKTVLVAFIFAIGLMVMLPSTSSGSASPPGQSSFVIGHIDIAQAIAFVQENTFIVYQSRLVPATVLVQEKGGCAIEKSLNTSLDIGYSNRSVIVKPPDYFKFCNYDFRLYRPLMVYQSQKFIKKYIASVHRYARDGLTQV